MPVPRPTNASGVVLAAALLLALALMLLPAADAFAPRQPLPQRQQQGCARYVVLIGQLLVDRSIDLGFRIGPIQHRLDFHPDPSSRLQAKGGDEEGGGGFVDKLFGLFFGTLCVR